MLSTVAGLGVAARPGTWQPAAVSTKTSIRTRRRISIRERMPYPFTLLSARLQMWRAWLVEQNGFEFVHANVGI